MTSDVPLNRATAQTRCRCTERHANTGCKSGERHVYMSRHRSREDQAPGEQKLLLVEVQEATVGLARARQREGSSSPAVGREGGVLHLGSLLYCMQTSGRTSIPFYQGNCDTESNSQWECRPLQQASKVHAHHLSCSPQVWKISRVACTFAS